MKFKESEIVELKKSTSELKEAIVSISAILNKHKSGKLYFGIKNDGTVVGQNVSVKTIRRVSQTIAANIEPKIYPEIKKIKLENKQCISVNFKGDDIPYYAFGRAYMRVGDENRKLSAKELENVILKKNKDSMRWEKQVSERPVSEVNKELLKSFITKANSAGRLSIKFRNVKTTLNKLNLLKEDSLLNAGKVLFCYNSSAEVQAAVFAGTDKITFLDIKKYNGTIFCTR